MHTPKRSRSAHEPADAGPSGDSQQARIDAIAADVARRLKAGEPVDDAAIEREHHDLMPGLRKRLRDVRRLIAAAEQANRDGREEQPPTARERLLEEERRILCEGLDQYEVLDRVRYGGQGVIYRARQRGTKRIVALKVLLDGPLASERQRYRFEREIELVSRLQHPNIITVYESGVVRERPYYAMEFVEGQTIGDYVILHDLTPPQIVGLIVKVARAVNSAHQNGVIHRDLSPANILVDEHGQPRVFDFGLAKDTSPNGDDGRYTLSGQAVGTLPYISPEQAGGLDGKVDVRSDVYSLGVVLYELLTDTLPYPGGGEPHALRQAIISIEALPLRKAIALGDADRAPGLEMVNRDLEAVLAKALAKDKDERYQSAADLADDLQRYLSGEAVYARAHHRLYALGKTLRKHRWPAAVAMLFLAVAAASWLQIRSERDSARQAADIAYRLFDTALTDMEESVRPLAGGVAVRGRLMERLANELPELRRLAESDQALEPILTQLLEKQGDIAFEQGRRGEASEYYEAFLQRCLRFAEVDPADHGAAVIRACSKLAASAEEPDSWYERGVELGKAFLARDPVSDEARYELARHCEAFAGFLRNTGRHEQALEQLKHGLSLCPSLETAESPVRRWSRLGARLLSGQGLVLRELGVAACAEESLRRALHLRQDAVAQNPADVETRHLLLRSYRHLATLLADNGDVEQAKRLLQEATAEGRLLAQMDPTSTRWDRDRYCVLERLAVLCLRTGDVDQAGHLCREAVSVAERRPTLGDSGRDARDILGVARLLQGRVHMEKAAWTEACAAFEQAALIHESLLEWDPGNPEQLGRLANAHYWLGASKHHCLGVVSALPHYQRACDIYVELMRQRPGSVETALDLVAAQTSLAAQHMRVNRADADQRALELLSEAESLLAELNDAGKLDGHERWFADRSEAIRKNRGILSQRAERRAGSDS